LRTRVTVCVGKRDVSRLIQQDVSITKTRHKSIATTTPACSTSLRFNTGGYGVSMSLTTAWCMASRCPLLRFTTALLPVGMASRCPSLLLGVCFSMSFTALYYYRWVWRLDVLFRGPSLGPIPTDGEVGKIAATASDKDKAHSLVYSLDYRRLAYMRLVS